MAKTMQRAGARARRTTAPPKGGSLPMEPTGDGTPAKLTPNGASAGTVSVDYVLKGAIQTVPVDYVKPLELETDVLGAAVTKAGLPIKDMLIRGFIAGAFLGFATALAATVRSQGLPAIAGAVLFPVGFVLLVLLGMELATGNFALLPKGIAAGKVSTQQMVRNWAWVYVGNLAGCLFFAALFYVSMTNWGHPAPPVPGSTAPTLAQVVTTSAVGKVTAYEALGMTGWFLAVVKAILANWMVTVGVLMAFVSRSVIGKVVAMWLPIMTFFALGLEHSIVNMFVIPLGMMLDAPISVGDWWLWNQIPVTIGNIIGGALLTGLAVYVTHRPKTA